MNLNTTKEILQLKIFINMIRLKTLLKETDSNIMLAYQKIDKLPAGKLFDDAKNIESVFKMSKHSWNDVIVTYEKHEEQHRIRYINISDIHITQPNIQANKVKALLDNIDKLPRINAVQFEDGEIAIYDGHHRLVANWALGNTQIKVNIVILPKYDASGIDTPNDPTM
jgi:hypothetical protein